MTKAWPRPCEQPEQGEDGGNEVCRAREGGTGSNEFAVLSQCHPGDHKSVRRLTGRRRWV